MGNGSGPEEGAALRWTWRGRGTRPEAVTEGLLAPFSPSRGQPRAPRTHLGGHPRLGHPDTSDMCTLQPGISGILLCRRENVIYIYIEIIIIRRKAAERIFKAVDKLWIRGEGVQTKLKKKSWHFFPPSPESTTRTKYSALAVCHFYTCPLEISNYNFQFHSTFKEHGVFLL